MSVVGEVTYRRLPFQGFPDASLPIGIWGSEGQATGDATGGVLAITSLLSSTQQKSGTMFNMEWVHVQTNQAVSESGDIEIIGAAFPSP